MAASARVLTAQLGGIWYGTYATAACPICQPEARADQNALTLSDGASGLLLHCKKSACAFRDILAAAGFRAGPWRAPDPDELRQRQLAHEYDAARREHQARRCWAETRPIGGTAAEIYLRRRGITAPLPGSLRLHPAAYHGPSGCRLPALVARVEGIERFAVHRTFLAADGRGKVAIKPAKLMLGRCMGGHVALTPASGPLVIAEGIETGLSLAGETLEVPATIWAALSANGMKNVRLPDDPAPFGHRLTIATDGDDAGRHAGDALALRASALGWVVNLLPAPDGLDWNDLIRGRAAP